MSLSHGSYARGIQVFRSRNEAPPQFLYISEVEANHALGNIKSLEITNASFYFSANAAVTGMHRSKGS